MWGVVWYPLRLLEQQGLSLVFLDRPLGSCQPGIDELAALWGRQGTQLPKAAVR